jgi:hypothetical protein
LNTSRHNFWVKNLLVADFEESDEIGGLVQAEVEMQLNGYNSTLADETDYSLGINPDYEVATAKGWIPLRDITIGTILEDGNIVRGIVKEGVSKATSKGFAKAQLVWSEGQWKRQHSEPLVYKKQVLWQLLTDRNVFRIREPAGIEMSVRDYAEINDPMLEDKYWVSLMGR